MELIMHQLAVLSYLIENAPKEISIIVTGLGESEDRVDQFLYLHRLLLYLWVFSYTVLSSDLMERWIALSPEDRGRVCTLRDGIPGYINYVVPMRRHGEAQEFQGVRSEGDFIRYYARAATLAADGCLLQGVQTITTGGASDICRYRV